MSSIHVYRTHTKQCSAITKKNKQCCNTTITVAQGNYCKVHRNYIPTEFYDTDLSSDNNRDNHILTSRRDYLIYPELVNVEYEKPLSVYEVRQETIRKKAVNMWSEVRNFCVCISALEQMKFGNINDCANKSEEHWCKNCKLCKCYH